MQHKSYCIPSSVIFVHKPDNNSVGYWVKQQYNYLFSLTEFFFGIFQIPLLMIILEKIIMVNLLKKKK